MNVMLKVVLALSLAFIGSPELPAQAQPAASGQSELLKLLISVEQQKITTPFPVRVTLHIHNAGPEPLWLYRHVRSPRAMSRLERAKAVFNEDTPRQANESSGGSTLEARLESESAQQGTTPGRGDVLESVGLSHPKLIRVAPGDDYEEKAVVHLEPALAGTGDEGKPIWGRYRFSVVYGAKYSNATSIERILGVRIWQGEVSSNTIDLDLEPPAGSGLGSAAGSVVGADGRTISDMLVTLSDERERSVEQTLTDAQGRFSFGDLPPGLYWVTARRENSSVDTAVFRHEELSSAEPAKAIELVMLPPEIYQAKQMLHKPVLIRITDGTGAPAANVGLEATWSSGTVLDSVKGETSSDGTATLELLPGRNFITLRQRGCKKQDELADVAAGDGIDGFKFTLECK